MNRAERRRRHKNVAIEHFLISLALDRRAHMHCYLMTDDPQYLSVAADRLLSEAEKLGCSPLMGVMTPLVDDVEAVREIIRKRGAEEQRSLREATDFHFSIWVTNTDDPVDAQLMAMH